MEVLPANHPPLVGPQVVVTTTGTPVSGTVAATDPDDDVVTFALRLLPRSGTVVVAPDGSFTYTPRQGHSGVDLFTVVACDDGDPQLCSTAVVVVNVYPIAVDDGARTTEGTPVTIPVLDNDSGAMNEPPEVTSPPSSGTVRVEGKRIVYEPDAGFTGTDTFGYRICSPGAVPLCAEATVTVDVARARTARPPTAPPEPTNPTPGPGTGGSNGGPGTTTEVSSPTLGGLAATGGPTIAIVAGGVLMVLVGRRTRLRRAETRPVSASRGPHERSATTRSRSSPATARSASRPPARAGGRSRGSAARCRGSRRTPPARRTARRRGSPRR